MAKQAKPAKQDESVVRFTVNGEAYEIDAERLTLGETADAEAHFQSDFDDLYGSQATLALVYIALKRRKPSTTWADVASIELGQLGEEEPTRPTKTPARSGSQS